MSKCRLSFREELYPLVVSGDKDVTRRVVIPPQPFVATDDLRAELALGNVKAPYGPNDVVGLTLPHWRLSEKLGHEFGWQELVHIADFVTRVCRKSNGRSYRLNSAKQGIVKQSFHKNPAFLMPRWACVHEAMIASVRAERVQEITEEDCYREGVGVLPEDTAYSAREEFRILWDRINADRGHAWEDNPWVWRIELTDVRECRETMETVLSAEEEGQ